VLAPAAALAMAVSARLAFRRAAADPPVYGQHLKQILMTTRRIDRRRTGRCMRCGTAVIRCRCRHRCAAPSSSANVAIAKYRLLAMLVGLVVFAGIQLVLNRTKIGLLIRAGVENREMVEALAIASAGCSSACSWSAPVSPVSAGDVALYREQVHASMGNDLTVLVFIVVIIAASARSAAVFIGALLVAMVANYGGFLVPKLALVSNILLMVAILMWRPRGLYAVTSR